MYCFRIILRLQKHFFTVLYINPGNKAPSAEFKDFIDNIENLYYKFKNEKPYAMFFAGDFNGQSQDWWPDSDTQP